MHPFRSAVGCLGIAVSLLAWPHPVSAADADFKMINRTGYQIDEIYVSPHSSSKWGPDVLGKQSLGDSEFANITFPRNNDVCVFDIKVKYHDDDSTAEWSKIDLCSYSKITLYWDAKAQVTRAVGE